MNKRLNATLTIGGAVASSLRSAFGTTSSEVDRVGSAISRLKDRQKELNRTIQDQAKLGRGANALVAGYAQDELDEVARKLEKLRSLQERINSAKSGMADGRSMIMSGGMTLGATAAVASAALVPIAQATAFEKAMLGVAKQVSGARDESGKLTDVYFNMAKQIQLLGRDIPIATNELADMVAAGARMGVAKDELIDFTRTAAMMASAFELPAGELADQMGKIAGLFKIPIPRIGELADAINYLDDNAISKGADIIDFLTRTGGVAGSVKVTGKEMAALGSTLLTLGERSETASTATNALFQKLAAADKGTKKFQATMAELGLSTSAVQKGMQLDAQGTILKVLEAINNLPAEKRLGALVDMVGLEHSDTVAKLASNVGEYRKQIDMVNSQQVQGSMGREFAATLATTSAQWETSKNRMTEIGVNIGSVLLPAVNSLLGVFGGAASAVADFVREHKTLVTNIALAAGTIGTVVAGFSSLKIGVGAAVLAFNALKLAIATNPIGLIVTALAVGAVLIYNNWEPIKAFFSELWGNIKTGATIAWDYLSKAWLNFTPLGLVVKNWGPIKDWFTGLFSDIEGSAKKAFEWILTKIETLGGFWSKTKSLFGFGNSAPTQVQPPTVPNAPPMATGRGSVQLNDHSQNTIQIVQQPGEKGEDLARRVDQIMKDRENKQRRGALYDPAMGY